MNDAFTTIQFTQDDLKSLRGALFTTVDGLKGWSALSIQLQYPTGQVSPLPIDEDFTYSDMSDKSTFSTQGVHQDMSRARLVKLM